MSTNIVYVLVVERLSDKPASVKQKYIKHLHYFSGEITLLNFSSLFIFQDRVKKWMDYTWSQQKSFDEHAMLSYLPLKMRTDIAMRVHYSTLGKVKLFRNCEPGLLKDLVVLLRPVIYLPGDYICRKNDIGKEMFIIQSGQVQVWNVVYLFKGDLISESLSFWFHLH